LTNWGEDPIVPDLTPDENSVQLIAFMQVCGGAGTTFNVDHSLNYLGAGTVNGDYEVEVTTTTKQPVK